MLTRTLRNAQYNIIKRLINRTMQFLFKTNFLQDIAYIQYIIFLYIKNSISHKIKS